MKILVLLLIANISVSYGQSLIPYYKDGKYGYCNLNKEIVIKPQYDGCGFFNEGLAWFKKGENFGYLNSSGKVIVKPKFSQASNFKYGTAIVYEGDSYYILNVKGKKVIKQGLAHAFRVADSLIACDMGWYNWQIINKHGRTVYEFEEIEFNWDNMDYISVYDTAKNYSVFINMLDGSKQIENPVLKYTFQNPDSLKLTSVTKTSNLLQITKGIVTDKNNTTVIPEEYETILSGNNMEFIFCMANYDKTGKSQIYISSKKKLSGCIPGLISGVEFEQNNEPFGYQIISGKYYFLCQLTAEGLPDVQNYICVDEDGNTFYNL